MQSRAAPMNMNMFIQKGNTQVPTLTGTPVISRSRFIRARTPKMMLEVLRATVDDFIFQGFYVIQR